MVTRTHSCAALALLLATATATLAACGGGEETGEQGPRCGDLVVDPGECEDGNLFNGDGCSSTCQPESGYSCSPALVAACTTVCGDGIQAGAEACDDSNTEPGDGCDALCAIETPAVEDCTNGVDDDGDDAADCDDSDCTCTPVECGNGVVETGEACDDGPANGTPESDCTTECRSVGCGDGVVSGEEACDEGASNADLASCTTLCQPGPLAGCSDAPVAEPASVDLAAATQQVIALDSLTAWAGDPLWESCAVSAFSGYGLLALRNSGEEVATVRVLAAEGSTVQARDFAGCGDLSGTCEDRSESSLIPVAPGSVKFIVVALGEGVGGSVVLEPYELLAQGETCTPGAAGAVCDVGLECRPAAGGNQCLPPLLAEGERCLATAAVNPCVEGTRCRIIDTVDQGLCTAEVARPADANCVIDPNAIPCVDGYRCTRDPLAGTTTCTEWVGAVGERCGTGGAARCGEGLDCVDAVCAGTPGASCDAAPLVEDLGGDDVSPTGLGISVTPVPATGYTAAPCVSAFSPAYLARFVAPDRGLLRVEVASEVTAPSPMNWNLGLMNGCGDFATPLACVTENVSDALLLEQTLEADQEVTLVFSGADVIDAVVSFVPYLREGRACDSTGELNRCDTGLLCVSGTCQAAAEGACEAPYQLLSLAEGDPEDRGALITVPAATADTVLDSCGSAPNDVTVLVQPPYAARVRVNWTGAPLGGAVSIAFGCAGSRTEVGCSNVAPSSSAAAIEVLIPADRNVLVSFSIPAGVTDPGFASFQYSRLGGEGSACNASIPCDAGLTCTRFSPFFPDGTCTRPG